ncbi:putative aarF domain-containing protein kinase 2 [Liparis tanakae]|uniref:Putative aarF domain-containing protein kinase 2 n=1 Tax=Liparis tanakae TaxID=230148 RepID=A0A4Z2DYK3_9TELE|nr:putative aarF domain-containing protein kinase 2 [Liparis tanakae]
MEIHWSKCVRTLCVSQRKPPRFLLISFLQGDRVAELLLNHARANECRDVPQFKKEMSQLVDRALGNTLALGKVPTSAWALRVCVSDAG